MKMTHTDCPGNPRGHLYEVQGAIRCTMCNLFAVLRHPKLGRAPKPRREEPK